MHEWILFIFQSSLAKAQTSIEGFNSINIDYCKILNEHKELITIFKFDSKHYLGDLEGAILKSLFNGKYLSS